MATDWGFAAETSDEDSGGIFAGLTTSEPGGLAVDITQGTAYDDQGRRCRTSGLLQVDLSQTGDTAIGAGGTPAGGSSTAPGAGAERWVSIFLKFDRILQDPRVDGTGTAVDFERLESFRFNVAMGAASVNPPTPATDLAPSPVSGKILLGDFLINNAGAIINRDFSRRQNWFRRVTGAAPTTRAGSGFATRGIDSGLGIRDVLELLLGYYNDHVEDTADGHAVSISQQWFDSTGISAVTPDGAIEEILADLVGTTSPNSGAHKIGSAAIAGSPNALTAQSVSNQLGQLLVDINNHILTSGAHTAANITNVPAGDIAATTVQAALNELDAEKAGVAQANIFSAGNTFDDQLFLGGGLLGTDVNAEKPRIRWNAAAAATSRYTLLHETLESGGTIRARTYFDTDTNGYRYTINARWDHSAATWIADTTASPATSIGIDISEVQLLRVDYKRTTTTPWAFNAWDATPRARVHSGDGTTTPDGSPGLILADGHLQVSSASAGNAGSNIPVDQIPVPNTLYAKTIPKAWGLISVTGGTPTIEGVNFSVSADGGANRLVVTLNRAMANSNYAVVAAAYSGSNPEIWTVDIISTTVFHLYGYDILAAGALDVDAGTHELAIEVFGQV
jgi:hypothetical protein